MDIKWEAPFKVMYRNYKGVVSERTIVAWKLYWGSTEYHPEPQWILTAWDESKKDYRDFALKDMWK